MSFKWFTEKRFERIKMRKFFRAEIYFTADTKTLVIK